METVLEAVTEVFYGIYVEPKPKFFWS